MVRICLSVQVHPGTEGLARGATVWLHKYQQSRTTAKTSFIGSLPADDKLKSQGAAISQPDHNESRPEPVNAFGRGVAQQLIIAVRERAMCWSQERKPHSNIRPPQFIIASKDMACLGQSHALPKVNHGNQRATLAG